MTEKKLAEVVLCLYLRSFAFEIILLRVLSKTKHSLKSELENRALSFEGLDLY